MEPEKRRAEIGLDLDTFEMVSRALDGRTKPVAVTLVAQYNRDELPGQEISTWNRNPFQNVFAALNSIAMCRQSLQQCDVVPGWIVQWPSNMG
jgi:hypothetical protein